MSWTLKFCTPDTEEDHVSLEVGRGGGRGSRRSWRDWHKGRDPNEIAFPSDLANAHEVWIKATAVNGREVHMCVKYDGNNCQKMTFDENEEHEVSRDNRDDCGC